MRLVSPVFRNDEEFPKRFTCEGENISPELSWEEAPKETKSFVLILHDPDAPRRNGFTHWVLYDIPPTITRVRENVPKVAQLADAGMQGRNDSGEFGYTGPCPPSAAIAISRDAMRFERSLACPQAPPPPKCRPRSTAR